jgi:molybdenum cofactor cytidylyltransferase
VIAAVVAAAGRSERMGRPKPLLACGPTTFLGAILDTLAASPVDSVRVVLGHAAETVKTELGLPESVYVVNLNYDAGMLSSIRTGLHALPLGTRAFLLWPVDHPRVSGRTVKRLIEAFERTGAPVVLPVHAGRRGHPVLFSARLIPELVAAPDDQGARFVVRAHAEDVVEVEVEDPGVTEDLDTPDAYARAFGHPPR